MSGDIASPIAVNHPAAVRKDRPRHRRRTRFSLNSAEALYQTVAAHTATLVSEPVLLAALAQLRLPGMADTEVRLRRLLGVCAWSALLGAAGMMIGTHILFGIFTEMPLWYVALFVALGVPGLTVTVVSFLTLHKGQLPWRLLGVASAAEAFTLIATILS